MDQLRKKFASIDRKKPQNNRNRKTKFKMSHLQLRQTAEQVKYSSGKKEYRAISLSDSSPQKRSLRP